MDEACTGQRLELSEIVIQPKAFVQDLALWSPLTTCQDRPLVAVEAEQNRRVLLECTSHKAETHLPKPKNNAGQQSHQQIVQHKDVIRNNETLTC